MFKSFGMIVTAFMVVISDVAVIVRVPSELVTLRVLVLVVGAQSRSASLGVEAAIVKTARRRQLMFVGRCNSPPR